MNTLPELLAPAGSFDAALAAFAYGADAIYLGLSRFSARADAANFAEPELRQIVAYAHNKGRKVYVTLNTLLETRELPELTDSLALLDEVAVDGVIVQDLGLAAWIRRAFPRLPLHASTQLACTSTAGARALKELGFVRVVTARELGLQEAAEIGRQAGVEIEAFVHGALCYSLSGLCLYSSLTTGRSGNRGRCAYCCRQPFTPDGGEACHPFSMRDLALLDEAKRLRTVGLASLKIEGRMKNPLYVAAVTDLYRHALDGDLSAEALQAKADDLRTIFSRPWTHLYADGPAKAEDIIDARSVGHRGQPIGTVLRVVRDVDEAIAHINQYGSGHSDSILTTNPEHAEKFLNEVDSSTVYSNASTRFTDGGEFGFGAEIGISTDKLHARGPMGLRELTSYKYKVRGSGQIRS